jgi:hypothetical protein
MNFLGLFKDRNNWKTKLYRFKVNKIQRIRRLIVWKFKKDYFSNRNLTLKQLNKRIKEKCSSFPIKLSSYSSQ